MRRASAIADRTLTSVIGLTLRRSNYPLPANPGLDLNDRYPGGPARKPTVVKPAIAVFRQPADSPDQNRAVVASCAQEGRPSNLS